MIPTRTNTKTRTNERRSPPSTDARARAKRQRERERETILIAVSRVDGSLCYTTLKKPTLSLPLFSLPRFSCGTLSGASSHFALVASHSVSLPNIVGVVFCTRIRIRSSSGTMKLTKGLYTRRKEGRKKKRKSKVLLLLLFLSVLFFVSFWRKKGRR